MFYNVQSYPHWWRCTVTPEVAAPSRKSCFCVKSSWSVFTIWRRVATTLICGQRCWAVLSVTCYLTRRWNATVSSGFYLATRLWSYTPTTRWPIASRRYSNASVCLVSESDRQSGALTNRPPPSTYQSNNVSSMSAQWRQSAQWYIFVCKFRFVVLKMQIIYGIEILFIQSDSHKILFVIQWKKKPDYSLSQWLFIQRDINQHNYISYGQKYSLDVTEQMINTK